MTDSRPTAALVAWRVVAVVAALVAVASTAISIQLDLATLPALAGDPLSSGSASSATIPGLAMALPGALLMWRLGGHPIAVVLTVFGVLWAIDGPAAGVVNLALVTGADSPLASWGFWYFARFGSILLMPIQLILLLFPDGRLATGAWRVVSIVSIVLGSIMPASFILQPAESLADGDPVRIELLDRFDPGILALPLTPEIWSVVSAIAFPAAGVAVLLALAVTISRRRGASQERRSQLRWLIWSGVVFLALVLASEVLPSGIGDVLFALGIAFVSGSVVIAVTRHGLYAIDRLLSWTLVYGILIVSVILVDVAIYLLVGAAFDDRLTMLIALIIVVIIYAPLRDRLFRAASRLVNGTRDDPYAVVSELASRLESAGGPREQLSELARSVSSAFASAFVLVELDRADGTVLAASVGTPADETIVLPLQHEGQEIGRIRMLPGRRPTISTRDRKLLGDLVRLAAASIRNAELSRELQSIREGLVATREEERSRLRRELHDGLGPLLGGIRLRLETSRNLIESKPEQSLAALDSAIAESSEVIAEIRRLVHDLRPPALDDLGLVRAIEQQADRLSGGPLTIHVHRAQLPELSAAVEVAAYRIVSEALTNVARHANASSACVRLSATDRELEIEVEDDGDGMRDDATPGVGLASLRARVAELGGSVEFLPNEPGTIVRARLPRQQETSND